MAGDTYLVNGFAYSAASAILKINGVRYFGWKSIEYGDKLEVGVFHGGTRSQGPIARTSGKYVPNVVKLVTAKHVTNEIRKDLAALAPDGRSVGAVIIPTFTLQLIEPNVGNHLVEFIGARLVTDDGSIDTQSADAVTDNLEFNIMRILRDKRSLANLSAI